MDTPLFACRFARLIVAVALAASSFWARISAAQSPLTTSQWREDLRYLARRLPVIHPNLYHRISPAEFEASVATLERRIPELTAPQILVELARLTAFVGEVHTGVMVTRQPREILATLHGYPIRFYAFDDGLFVLAVDSTWAQAAGRRVLRIGTLPADQALRRVAEIIPADNPMWIKRYGPGHLAVAEVLHTLGITPTDSGVALTLEAPGGDELRITLTPRPLPAILDYLNPLMDPAPRPDVAFAPAASEEPMWLKDQRSRFWAEYLPGTRSLYLQINAMLDKPGESIRSFFDRTLSLADSLQPDRLIVDIRQNNGGNHLALPLIHGIIRRPALDQEGKLFVVIGRGTVSAGQNLATLLDLHTRAVFVGEPTASRPNHYGVVGTFSLPHSRIFVWHARLLVQDSDPGDYRAWLAPDVSAPLTSYQYFAGRDSALEAILAYQPLPPLADTLDAAHRSGGLASALSLYRTLAPRYRAAGRSTEADLNTLGYRLLGRRGLADAVAVFELNAWEHPGAFNVYDSLGDAYLRAGQREAGLASYRRSVELNPENEHARRVLAAAALER